MDGFTNIGAVILLFYFLKPGSQAVNHEKKEEVIPEAISAYKDKTYLFFIVLVTLFAICFFQLFSTIPNYFRDDLHLSERFIGFVMAINGIIIVALEMVLVYTLEKKNRLLRYITIGTIVCSLSYFSLLLPGNAKLITLIMILLITFGEISAMPFMNSFWTMRSNEKNRGQYAALYTIAWGVAQTLGPFFCSRLVDATSFPVLFCVMGFVGLLTAFGFYRLGKM